MQSPIPSPLALARAQPRRRSARPCHSREAAQGRAAAAARAPTPRAPRPAGPAPSLPHSPRAGRAAAPGALHARPRRCHGPASRRSVAAEPAAAPPPRPAPLGAAHARHRSRLRAERGGNYRGCLPHSPASLRTMVSALLSLPRSRRYCRTRGRCRQVTRSPYCSCGVSATSTAAASPGGDRALLHLPPRTGGCGVPMSGGLKAAGSTGRGAGAGGVSSPLWEPAAWMLLCGTLP